MTDGDAPWDLVVLGGGTAGLVAAHTAAALGARVLLVERDRTGGDCLWTGCVPSKALIAAARLAHDVRAAAALGVDAEPAVDFRLVMRHIRESIATIEPVDSVTALESAGVTVITDEGEFTSQSSIRVGTVELNFHHALVATGSEPRVPSIPGMIEAALLTSETVWALEALPPRLLVLGGGSVGCELGQAFTRLGSEVTLVEEGPRILPNEDPDAAAIVHDALASDGIRMLVNHSVAAVEARPGNTMRAVVDGRDGQAEIDADQLLVAVGRQPRTDSLRLDEAGVDTDSRGCVLVDRSLRTTNPQVWAAGDVTALPQFTHVAGVHGSIAATNAVLGVRRKASVRAVPRVIFTDPEIGSVGVATAGDPRNQIQVETIPHKRLDRAIVDGRTEGFSRLALDRRRRLVGATIVGPRAGESLAEATIAVERRLSVTDLATVMHAYPTYSDGVWNTSIETVRGQLAQAPWRQLAWLAVRLSRSRASRRT